MFFKEGKVQFFGLEELKDGDSRIVNYTICFEIKEGQLVLHCSRVILPQDLQTRLLSAFFGKEIVIIFFRKNNELIFHNDWKERKSANWQYADKIFDPVLGKTHIGIRFGISVVFRVRQFFSDPWY